MSSATSDQSTRWSSKSPIRVGSQHGRKNLSAAEQTNRDRQQLRQGHGGFLCGRQLRLRQLTAPDGRRVLSRPAGLLQQLASRRAGGGVAIFKARQQTVDHSTVGAFEFAVVDVETTGLDRQADRVVELAVVLVDASGRVLYEWTTLLDPGPGGAGPTKIHGITDEMAALAPPFSSIAGDLAYMLAGRIVVAHNAPFDVAFIEQSFYRSEMALVQPAIRYIDTMEIAEALQLPRKLGDLCAHLGVFFDPHNALDDARAASQVLTRMLPRIKPSALIATSPAVFARVTTGRDAAVLNRDDARSLLNPTDLIASAVFRFKPSDAPAETVSTYVASVRSALAVMPFTTTIGHQLVNTAIELGLSAGQTREAHHTIICEMFDEAVGDGRVTAAERALLTTRAAWLGVDITDFDAWVKAGKVRRKLAQAAFREWVKNTTIVMTGKGVHPANIREALALKHGFVLKNQYRPDVALVVIGSETTATAVVTTAREAGIEIMIESVFWRKLGEL
jgi:DNA polymerase III subunit epsilon